MKARKFSAYFNAKSAYRNENFEIGSLFYQDEYCLYLNIWKADDSPAQPKPVMVWIHGGAFEAGGTVDPMFDCHKQYIACTNELLEILGCKTVADLLKVDAQKVFDASSALFLRQFPERDGKYLPLEPFEAYANGAAKDIDFIQDCNKDEMNFFVYSFGFDDRKNGRSTT